MAEELESKITDEHRAYIGRTSESGTVLVRAEDAARVRGVLQDDDPRWAEGTNIAPPYLLAALSGGTRAPAPSVLPSAIMTQQEWRFTRPFRIGEQLRAVSQVIDLRDRLGGRYGYSVLVTTSTDYYDTAGEHVAAQLVSITQFDPKSVGGRE